MRSHAPLLTLALLLLGCPGPAEAPPGSAPPTTTPTPAPPPPAPLPHDWPPEVGDPFPELVLLDDTGATLALSALRGKVLLVHPVAVGDAACQDLSALDGLLEAGGIDPRRGDLALVFLLLRDAQGRAPGVDDARAWVEKHGLRDRGGAFLLVGDDRYAAHAATAGLIGALFAVEPSGIVVASARPSAPPEERAGLVASIQPLLGAAPPPEASAAAPRAGKGFPDPESFPEAKQRARIAELATLLPARRFEELDARFAQARKVGRLEGTYKTEVELFSDWILTRDDARDRELIDAWVKASPRSAWARAVRCERYVDWAWEARGSGYANTVTEEGWRLFHERLEQAAVDVEAALRLDPGCELALMMRMTVAMGRGVDPSTAAKWFEPVRALRPPLVGAWNRYLNYLMPKWHGDEEGKQMWALARGAVKAHPDEPAFQLLILSAHEEMERAEKGYLRAHLSEVRAAIVGFTSGYPKSRTAWSYTCWVAKEAGDLALWRKGLERAAEEGDAQSQEWLANRLEAGKDGFPRDPAKARLFHWRAAQGGMAYSQAMVGMAYLYGDGVSKDPVEAVRWFELGAARGETAAQIALAECFEQGMGAARDPVRALELYRGAAKTKDAQVRALATAKAAELERELGAGTKRAHPDGFDDWYPDDVTAPAGTRYPCPFTALPRALGGIPKAERRYANHVGSLLLRAIHARLRVWHNLAHEEALERYTAETTELRAAIAKEPAPPGLEPFRDDLLAALDGQLVFLRKVVAGVIAELPRLQALTPEERERRFQAVLKRLVDSTVEGRQASDRLRAAWSKLEARWGKTWQPAVKDSLFHHLCALDVF